MFPPGWVFARRPTLLVPDICVAINEVTFLWLDNALHLLGLSFTRTCSDKDRNAPPPAWTPTCPSRSRARCCSRACGKCSSTEADLGTGFRPRTQNRYFYALGGQPRGALLGWLLKVFPRSGKPDPTNPSHQRLRRATAHNPWNTVHIPHPANACSLRWPLPPSRSCFSRHI